MLPAITKSIEVPCGQELAFRTFVEDMGLWWPGSRFSVSAFYGKAPSSLRVEARVGGRVVEVAYNGVEHHWGTFKSYNPYQSFSMDFHNAQGKSAGSLLTLDFEALSDSLTRVTLVHSGWEGFGEQARMMMGGYLTGWGEIFDKAYSHACANATSQSPETQTH